MNTNNTPTVLFTKSEAVALLDQAFEKYGDRYDLILDRSEGVLFWMDFAGGGEWRLVEVTHGLFAVVLIPVNNYGPYSPKNSSTKLLTSDGERVPNFGIDVGNKKDPLELKVKEWTMDNIVAIVGCIDREEYGERFSGLANVPGLDEMVDAYRQDEEDARIEEMNERRSFEIEDVVGKAFHD